jgi:hypothetical protein
MFRHSDRHPAPLSARGLPLAAVPRPPTASTASSPTTWASAKPCKPSPTSPPNTRKTRETLARHRPHLGRAQLGRRSREVRPALKILVLHGSRARRPPSRTSPPPTRHHLLSAARQRTSTTWPNSHGTPSCSTRRNTSKTRNPSPPGRLQTGVRAPHLPLRHPAGKPPRRTLEPHALPHARLPRQTRKPSTPPSANPSSATARRRPARTQPPRFAAHPAPHQGPGGHRPAAENHLIHHIDSRKTNRPLRIRPRRDGQARPRRHRRQGPRQVAHHRARRPAQAPPDLLPPALLKIPAAEKVTESAKLDFLTDELLPTAPRRRPPHPAVLPVHLHARPHRGASGKHEIPHLKLTGQTKDRASLVNNSSPAKSPSSSSRSRPAAPASISPPPTPSSTTTPGGTPPPKTRPPTAPTASARTSRSSSTSSSAAAPSRTASSNSRSTSPPSSRPPFRRNHQPAHRSRNTLPPPRADPVI